MTSPPGVVRTSTTGAVPRVGFVLERSLGHITHADNLESLLAGQPDIDAALVEVEFDTHGAAARIPVFNSNWTVRAGLRARAGIRHLRRGGRLDALFVHTQVPAVLSPDWLARIPTVVSLDATPLQYDELGEHYAHAVGSGRMEQLKWRANRACFRRAAHIVAWAEWTKQGVIDGYGIEADKITVIPPGVNPSLWRADGERAASDGPVQILFVGGDLRRKGGDVLLAAFAELRARQAAKPDGVALELHLVTKAPVPDTAGVVVHADMGPNSPELIALYHRSHVFCLPTRGDCLPMVLSEAGAAGLPLVSTAVAGIPEIVQDGRTGIVVPPDDVAALVRALSRLVEDSSLRQRLGSGAQAMVDLTFDAEKNVRRLVALLRDVAARGSVD